MRFNFYSCAIISIIIFFSSGFKISRSNTSSQIIKKRILIIAPHPDDETLGCAKVISKNVSEGTPVKIILMTNGDLYYTPKGDKLYDFDRDGDTDTFDYGYIRQQESLTAMGKLGIKSEDVIFLGYPDASLWEIYSYNYNDIYINLKDGFEFAMVLRVRGNIKSPFKNSYHLKTYGKKAIYTRENIIKDLERILSDFKPTDVYVTHELDFHDDHKATAFFLRKAIEELRKKASSFPRDIKIHRYLIHYDIPEKPHMMDVYPDPENPRLGVRNFFDNCRPIPWDKTIIGSSPNGSIILEEDFKKLKHELIDCYQTQIFDDYFPKSCKGEVRYSWLHQFVKDREEWWDWPINYYIPFDYYDKWGLSEKIKYWVKSFTTILLSKAKKILSKSFK